MPQSQPVDFARELDVVQAFLAKERFRVAVIGGARALAAYGHPRLTLDLDVVTEAGHRIRRLLSWNPRVS